MSMQRASASPSIAPPEHDLLDDVGGALMLGGSLMPGLPLSGAAMSAGLLLRLQGSMGNQAAQGLAALRGDGLDGLEGFADRQLSGLADGCADVPGLNVLAAVGAQQAQDGVEVGVGAARFGIDMVSDGLAMASHPLDAIRGLETMASHCAGLPWWMRKLNGLGADTIGLIDGDTRASELVANLARDPISQRERDNTYWRGAAEGLVAPMAEPLSKGRYWEAAGYAMAGVGSLLLGDEVLLGKAANATKGGRALRAAEVGEVAGGAPAAQFSNKIGAEAAGVGEAAKSLDAAAGAGKAESGAIKAWRATEGAEEALTPGRAIGETVDNGARDAVERPHGPVVGEGNRAKDWQAPPTIDREGVRSSILQAQADLATDPRLPAFDAESMDGGARLLRERAQVARLAEDLCRANPKMSWADAVHQATREAPQRPAYMGRPIESYIPGSGVAEDAPRVLHVSDQIDPAGLDETVYHEAIHTLALPGFNDARLMPFNEGVTQWLTKMRYAESNAYPEHVAIIEEVAGRVGEDELIEAFTYAQENRMSDLLEGNQPGYGPEVLQRLNAAQERLNTPDSTPPLETGAP